MINLVDAQQLAAEERPNMRLTMYMGSVEVLERGPQAFIVDANPGYVSKAHFHSIDQFQVFVRGDAVGKRAIQSPATILYTDGYTPYGPLYGGDAGLKFFNLRPRGDLGAHHMPESRKELPRRPGRMIFVDAHEQDLATMTDVHTAELIAPEKDGLSVLETAAAAGLRLPPDLAIGAGRYELVIAGSFVCEDHEYGPESILFVSAGTHVPERHAGPGGVHVLSLQAPWN